MTATRPDRDSGSPYENSAYGDAGAFEAAVGRMDDPLNDPLPGQHPSPWFRSGGTETGSAGRPAPTAPQPTPPPAPQAPYDDAQQQHWYAAQDPMAQAADHRPAVDASAYASLYAEGAADEAYAPEPEQVPADDETVGLRTSDTRRMTEPRPAQSPADRPERAADTDGERPAEGRAARRRAAQQAARRGGHRKRPATPASAPNTKNTKPDGTPMTRLEARRAERARKPSPAVIASRAVGELFISVGVLMLLFVTYQLWWTNIRAGQQAGSEASRIHEDWANGKRKPGAFQPGQGFAIMHIPRLDVVVPVAEGIDKERVLDRGMVGHYADGALKTAMPEDKQGNFAVAGHRNTHGEPFRYINRLEKGDEIVVETQDTYYVYSMQSILPQTSPSNIKVIDPIPKGSGFTRPGRYITLTTCTPEFTSTYRMIVWGKMVEERPRSKGKPDALVR